MPKEDLYKGIKIIGFVTFIPFMLAAGPLTGYFVGTFLREKFHLSFYSVILGVVLGFCVAISETVKILKAVAKVNKK